VLTKGMKRFNFKVIAIVTIFIAVFLTLGQIFSEKGFENLAFSIALALLYLIGFSFLFKRVELLIKKIRITALLKAIGLISIIITVLVCAHLMKYVLSFIEIGILIALFIYAVILVLPEKWLQRILEELGQD
jgi:hypothetical protein